MNLALQGQNKMVTHAQASDENWNKRWKLEGSNSKDLDIGTKLAILNLGGAWVCLENMNRNSIFISSFLSINVLYTSIAGKIQAPCQPL